MQGQWQGEWWVSSEDKSRCAKRGRKLRKVVASSKSSHFVAISSHFLHVKAQKLHSACVFKCAVKKWGERGKLKKTNFNVQHFRCSVVLQFVFSVSLDSSAAGHVSPSKVHVSNSRGWGLGGLAVTGQGPQRLISTPRNSRVTAVHSTPVKTVQNSVQNSHLNLRNCIRSMHIHQLYA